MTGWIRRRRRGKAGAPALLAAVAVAALAAGCADSRGIAEFAAFDAAQGTAHQAGQSILDRLAVAERSVFETSEPPLSVETAARFDPSVARYLVESVDPPATASLRASITVVHLYTEALAGLANGETAEALAARVGRIGATALAAGTELAAIPAGGAAPPGVSALVARISPSMSALAPLLEVALAAQSRAVFRDRLIADAPTVDALLTGLVEVTPQIHAVLTRPMLRDKETVRGTLPLSESEAATIRATKVLLATWVVLLEDARRALARAIDAVESGPGASAALLATTIELEATARAVRTALARSAQ